MSAALFTICMGAAFFSLGSAADARDDGYKTQSRLWLLLMLANLFCAALAVQS